MYKLCIDCLSTKRPLGFVAGIAYRRDFCTMSEAVTPGHPDGADPATQDDTLAVAAGGSGITHDTAHGEPDVDTDGGAQPDASLEVETDTKVDTPPATCTDTGVPLETATDTPEPTAALAAAVSAEIAPILAGIGAAIDRFHDRTSAQEQSARALQAHVETLQQDQVRQLLKPTFERLATLHAEAQRAAEGNSENTQAADDFAFFAESIEELLALYDLSSVEATVGGDFDAKLHHAQRAIPTAEEERSGKIQRVLRQGFGFAGAARVLLPARVTVFTFTPPADATVNGPPSDVAPAESPATADSAQTASLTPEQHRNETA